ncbi:DUF6191 domain-containing protein [Streptomyces sp. NPDC008121]|uniref:DUF6191 domain-containing protein n=1 Tax=Streptomyces sp. NPDC008121 TaxID=3364809 RepID=UPI0036EB6DA7
MIGSLFEQIFAPSSRYSAHERQRLALAKDENTASGMSGGPIDLDSGKVRIAAECRGAAAGAPGSAA